MNQATTVSIPTIFLVLTIIVVAILGVLIQYGKKKKNGENLNIDDYLPSILKAVQKAVEILMIDMDSFDTKNQYMESVVSTTIEYIKQNSTVVGIPTEVINMLNTDILTNYITKLINTYYFECFKNIAPAVVSAHSQLFEEHFVKCQCGIPGCECNEGECTCIETNYTDTVKGETYDENGNKIIDYTTTNEGLEEK